MVLTFKPTRLARIMSHILKPYSASSLIVMGTFAVLKSFLTEKVGMYFIIYHAYSLSDFRLTPFIKNSGSLVAVEGHRQTPKKHTSKPLNWFLCVSYIQTALNLAISLLREYQHVCATLCACLSQF